MNNAEWQPMETAPRDGTMILGWAGYYDIVWWDEMYGWQVDPGIGAHPKCWQPLPEPPKEKA